MMAEAQGGDDEIFVYMGGNQRVPNEVRRARIHISVKIVPRRAFYQRRQLIYVEFHDDVEIIEEDAFFQCRSLKAAIKLLGIKIFKVGAFRGCSGLTDVEFGGKLETIEKQAFYNCKALTKIKIPSVRTIGKLAFGFCDELSDVEFGGALRILWDEAFWNCPELKRVALPLKDGMIERRVFFKCPKLETVDLVGGIHHTVASLHLESWRSEMIDEINSINQTLPITDAQPRAQHKTTAIRQWMERVIRQLDYYKDEHRQLLKEAATLLELALWKANLADNNGGKEEREGVRTTRGSRKRARKEICVTSGASIVIKNVLPFLALK